MHATRYLAEVAEFEVTFVPVSTTWFYVIVGFAVAFAVLGIIALAMWFLYYRKKARNPR